MRAFTSLMHSASQLLAACGLTLFFGGALATTTAPPSVATKAAGVSAAASASVPPAASQSAGGSSAPGGIVVGTASITYFARSGDTLISIARQYTEKSGNWVALGRLNRIDRDSAIPIGTPILIPGELLADTPAKATVVAMTGNVSATGADGSATRLAIGATVVEGTRIQTSRNSFLTLALVDQSRISVPSNSRVEVARLRTARYLNSPRTQVLLLQGRVESRVAPLEANRGRFDVRTPVSVAGVRGTHFRVGFVEDRAGTTTRIATETLDGKVAVSGAANAGEPDGLLLTSGKGNITDRNSTGPAIDLLPAPRLASAGTSTGRAEFPATRIELLALSGARGYRVQIAKDAEAAELIAESRSPSTTVAIDGVPDGDYFARVSAIDRFGLEGFARIEPIRLHAAPAGPRGIPAPDAPRVGSSDDRTVTLRWTPVNGKSTRLQLARDADFSYLLVSRVTRASQERLPRPAFGTYYARIEVLDDNGEVTASSLAQPLIVTDQWIINDGNPVAVRQNRTSATR